MNIEKSLKLHEKWIKGETGGKCADFKGVNLKNVSFENANLEGASFIGAEIYSVSFKGANLENTKINYKYANEFFEA